MKNFLPSRHLTTKVAPPTQSGETIHPQTFLNVLLNETKVIFCCIKKTHDFQLFRKTKKKLQIHFVVREMQSYPTQNHSLFNNFSFQDL
jgi:hypothetical protein